MTRDLILGTAGHIDHGKTSLVKALTGVDCDRLPEEKARGITIDIGFANLDLPPYHIGIVDVPGHERFVKNMLAGATGIDLALLVVAADDSVMPQTREHLEILRLLGLRHGLIALTKADLVDDTTREVVEMEIRDLVRGTFLADASLIPTSAATGRGIAELRAAIASLASGVRSPESGVEKPKPDSTSFDHGPRTTDHGHNIPFRLAIDRAFVVQGHGTVVTGSVTSGSLRVGDEVEWLPSRQRVRIRSLQNHDQGVDEVHRGQRAALNLAGVEHRDVIRGQELATPGYLVPSRALTVRLYCLADGNRRIKHRLPVRLHLGTAEVMATVALLDCDSLAPGRWGLAQLFLEEEVVAIWGQPFVIRESSATVTLGGGQVLQPVARKIRRRNLEVQERIETLWIGDVRQRALTVAWFGGFDGFSVGDIVRGAGVAPAEAEQLVAELRASQDLVEIQQGARRRLLHRDMIVELETRLLHNLDRLHEQFPLMSTHDRQKVQSQLDYVGDDALVHSVVDRLIADRRLIGDLRRIGRADFKPKLSANLRKLKEKLIAAHQSAGLHPPEPESFAGHAGGNASNLRDLFDVCVAEGYLARVSDDIYLHADVEADMRRRVMERLQGGVGLTIADIRDLLGTTRKYAVPLCEYLDRIGVTRREGDLRFPVAGEPVSDARGGS
jgi:selenocysteine-specific elongation factor